MLITLYCAQKSERSNKTVILTTLVLQQIEFIGMIPDGICETSHWRQLPKRAATDTRDDLKLRRC